MAIAGAVGEGRAAQLMEQRVRGNSIQWDDLPESALATAAEVRAVAAAGVVVANRGADRGWVERMEALTEDAGSPPGRHVGAARVVAGIPSDVTEPLDLVGVAWLLWDVGLLERAVEHAQGSLDQVADPFSSGPQVQTADDLARRSGLFAAARAGLGAIVALAAADPAAAARDAAARTEDYGWSALTLSQRAEIDARLAIILHHVGGARDGQRAPRTGEPGRPDTDRPR